MEKNIGIECYEFLIEMEAENQKITEMIMAPKFAKLLNESVDETDLRIHNSKTEETISEFSTVTAPVEETAGPQPDVCISEFLITTSPPAKTAVEFVGAEV